MNDATDTEPKPADDASASAAVVVDAAATVTVDDDGVVRDGAGAIMKAIDEWAKAKKMLPMLVGGVEARVPPTAPDLGGVARVAMSGLTGPKMNPEYVRFARAKAFRAWPESKEVTEAEFDAAVNDAETHVCR